MEGEHELRPEALTKRLDGDEVLQLWDQLGVAAELQGVVDAFLPGRKPKLPELGGENGLSPEEV